MLTDALRDLASALERRVAAAPGANRAARAERLRRHVVDFLLPRARDASAPLIVVILGSTGSGKSSLFNGLVGRAMSPSGVLRPTTRRPLAVVHPDDAGPTCCRNRGSRCGLAQRGSGGSPWARARRCSRLRQRRARRPGAGRRAARGGRSRDLRDQRHALCRPGAMVRARSRSPAWRSAACGAEPAPSRRQRRDGRGGRLPAAARARGAGRRRGVRTSRGRTRLRGRPGSRAGCPRRDSHRPDPRRAGPSHQG